MLAAGVDFKAVCASVCTALLGAYRCHECPQQQVQAIPVGVVVDFFIVVIVGLPATYGGTFLAKAYML